MLVGYAIGFRGRAPALRTHAPTVQRRRRRRSVRGRGRQKEMTGGGGAAATEKTGWWLSRSSGRSHPDLRFAAPWRAPPWQDALDRVRDYDSCSMTIFLDRAALGVVQGRKRQNRM